MAERLYFKLWHLWWTSESHEDLGEDPIAIGPVLMSFCRWEPGRDNGWAVTEKGQPVTCGALARRARWSGRGAGERVAAALRELERVGTAELRSDGAWGLPKFGKWQESASAAKMRKARAKPKNTTDVTSHCGHSDHPCDQDVPPLEEEGAEADQNTSCSGRTASTNPDSSHTRQGPPTKPEPDVNPDPHAADTTTVLRLLNEARRAIDPESLRLRKRDHIRARLAEGATVADCEAVIAYARHQCERDRSQLEWLDAVTPFRPKNWESRLARALTWKRNAKPTGPKLDLGIDDLERKRQELEAWEASQRSPEGPDAG